MIFVVAERTKPVFMRVAAQRAGYSSRHHVAHVLRNVRARAIATRIFF
jgi:hypothetical protein